MHLSVVALWPPAAAIEPRWALGEPSVRVLNSAARLCSRWLFSLSPRRVTSILFCALSRPRAPGAIGPRPGEGDRFVENANRPPVVLEVAVNGRRGAATATDGGVTLPGDVLLLFVPAAQATAPLVDIVVVTLVAEVVEV